MAHRKVNSPEHLKNGEIFFWDTPLKIAQICFFSYFFTYSRWSLGGWVAGLVLKLKWMLTQLSPQLGWSWSWGWAWRKSQFVILNFLLHFPRDQTRLPDDCSTLLEYVSNTWNINCLYFLCDNLHKALRYN